MGSYMHLICRETKSYVEAFKVSGGGEIVNSIEQPKALIRFLNDHSGKVMEVVSDHEMSDLHFGSVIELINDYTRHPPKQEETP